MIRPMPWQYDDGGRYRAGYRGETGDCVVRAVAIATAREYQVVYDEIDAAVAAERRTAGRSSGRSSARTGLYKSTLHRYMRDVLRWTWTPTMGIGTGCRVHLRQGELPTRGPLIVDLSQHVAAVIDGVVYDASDPVRGGNRCVYGYWQPGRDGVGRGRQGDRRLRHTGYVRGMPSVPASTPLPVPEIRARGGEARH